ncbi:Verru_Chthon cassette protein C [Prosthecobacter sp. SYSU 5D2]|uniref:Verru_Chthon cassette protein C n=1 Tax=Prosthecobacter sp. SYSU 5D2 TaxID=3134134 RepID=UPI0031FEE705
MSPRHSIFRKPGARSRAAFTLVEVLVSMTVLLILLLISAQVIGTVQSTWTASNARVSQFREARTAFDIITRNLSQATLNTYIDYDQSYLQDSDSTDATATSAPSKYIRKSDLRFVSGPAVGGGTPLLTQGGSAAESPGHAVFFQAPLGVSHDPAFVGLDRLLCGRGYFVQYTSDEFFRPEVLPAGLPRFRYRLMEFSPPAEQNLVYDSASNDKWFSQAGVPVQGTETPVNHGLTRPIADNIIALIIAPMLETDAAVAGNGTTNSSDAYRAVFNYDSAINDGTPTAGGQGNQHRLPPLVKVVLVAIDERTADRLGQISDPSTPPFGTEISSALSNDTAAQNLNQTMEDIAKTLNERNVNFRIFSSTVAIRGAKWSN